MVKTNNNQAFYSQVSWGRLEIKPYESKKQRQNKGEKEEGKRRAIKNKIENRRKGNKMLSKKNLTKMQ
jgi:hypothetical protein